MRAVGLLDSCPGTSGAFIQPLIKMSVCFVVNVFDSPKQFLSKNVGLTSRGQLKAVRFLVLGRTENVSSYNKNHTCQSCSSAGMVKVN